MNIKDINKAKELYDKITVLTEILKSKNICNLNIEYYTSNGYRKTHVFSDISFIDIVRNQIKTEKDKLEKRLNEIL